MAKDIILTTAFFGDVPPPDPDPEPDPPGPLPDGSLTPSIVVDREPMVNCEGAAAYSLRCAIAEDMSYSPSSGTFNEAFDPAFGRVEYDWTSNQSGNWSAVSGLLPTEHQAKARAVGQLTRWVFDSGTPSVSVEAVDRMAANWGDASVTLPAVPSVLDAYPEAERIFVDPDSDWTNSPTSISANRVTSLSAAFTRYAAISAEKVVIFLNGGKTHNVSAGYTLDAQNKHLRIEGLGTRPVVTVTANVGQIFTAKGNWMRQLCLKNVEFLGTWNAASEKNDGYKLGTIVSFAARGQEIIFHTCKFHKLTDVLANQGQTSNVAATLPTRLLHVNTETVGCREFRTLWNDDAGEFSSIGSVVRPVSGQSVGASKKFSPGNESWGNSHGGDRVTGTNMFVNGCHQAMWHGWDGSMKPWPNGGFRVNIGNSAGYKAIICRSVLETKIQRENANDSAGPEQVCHILIDQCWLTWMPPLNNVAVLNAAPVIVRNSILYRPSAPYLKDMYGGIQPFAFFGFGINPFNKTLACGDTPIEIYSNTFVLEATTEDMNGRGLPVLTALPEYLYVTEANNAKYAPNLNTPLTADGPFDPVNMGFDHTYSGIKKNLVTTGRTITLASDVAPGGTVVFSYPTDEWGNATEQSEFSTGHRHIFTRDNIAVAENDFAKDKYQIGLTFGVSEITVQNTSGVTWAADLYEFRIAKASGAKEITTVRLDAAVTVGGTFTVPYPAGTSAVDYSTGDTSTFKLKGVYANTYATANAEKMTVAFGASTVTITNTSTSTWPAGSRYEAILARNGTGPTITAQAIPADKYLLWHPDTGAGVLGDVDTSKPCALRDYLGRVRPGTHHPLAAPGSPSRGALEPA